VLVLRHQRLVCSDPGVGYGCLTERRIRRQWHQENHRQHSREPARDCILSLADRPFEGLRLHHDHNF
jgi:hypothetical protein